MVANKNRLQLEYEFLIQSLIKRAKLKLSQDSNKEFKALNLGSLNFKMNNEISSFEEDDSNIVDNAKTQ
jgi:hypothetical protein